MKHKAEIDTIVAEQQNHLRAKEDSLRSLRETNEQFVTEQRRAFENQVNGLNTTIDQLRDDLNQTRIGHENNVRALQTKHEGIVSELRADIEAIRSNNERALADLIDEKHSAQQEVAALSENVKALSSLVEDKRIEIERLKADLDQHTADLNSTRVLERETLQTYQEREAEEKRRIQETLNAKIESLSQQNMKTLGALEACQSQVTVLQAENSQLAKAVNDEHKSHMMTTDAINRQHKERELDLSQKLVKSEAEISRIQRALEEEIRLKTNQIADNKQLEAQLTTTTRTIEALETKVGDLTVAIESSFTNFCRVRNSHSVDAGRNVVSQLNHMVEQHRRKQDCLEAAENQLQTTQVPFFD